MSILDKFINPTVEQIKETVLTQLKLRNFPVTSWSSGSASMQFIEAFVKSFVDLSYYFYSVSKLGLLDYADGEWLDVLAVNNYGITRKPITTSTLLIPFTNPTIGTLNINKGDIVFKKGNVKFENSHPFICAPNSTNTPLLICTEGLEESNNIGFKTMEKSFLGDAVNLTYPLLDDLNAYNTYYVPEETDSELKIRCKNVWGTISKAGTADGYKSKILEISGINRVTCREQLAYSDNQYIDVKIYVASSLGDVSSNLVNTAYNQALMLKPLGIKIAVYSAAKKDLIITGYTNIKKETLNQAITQFDSKLKLLCSQRAIGEDLRHEDIISLYTSLDGYVTANMIANNVILQSGSVVVCNENEVFLPINQVVFNGV